MQSLCAKVPEPLAEKDTFPVGVPYPTTVAVHCDELPMVTSGAHVMSVRVDALSTITAYSPEFCCPPTKKEALTFAVPAERGVKPTAHEPEAALHVADVKLPDMSLAQDIIFAPAETEIGIDAEQVTSVPMTAGFGEQDTEICPLPNT